MELYCEGGVRITIAETADPVRVTLGNCPDHGPFKIIERYDCEKGGYYLILNQFDWEYPKYMIAQALDYGHDIVTRMVHMYYMCILPIFGDIELTVVGYDRIKVREGKLLVIPARLWLIMYDVGLGSGYTITLAF